MSAALLEVHGLFRRFDVDDSGFVGKEEFDEAYQKLFPGIIRVYLGITRSTLDLFVRTVRFAAFHD